MKTMMLLLGLLTGIGAYANTTCEISGENLYTVEINGHKLLGNIEGKNHSEVIENTKTLISEGKCEFEQKNCRLKDVAGHIEVTVGSSRIFYLGCYEPVRDAYWSHCAKFDRKEIEDRGNDLISKLRDIGICN